MIKCEAFYHYSDSDISEGMSRKRRAKGFIITATVTLWSGNLYENHGP